MSYSMQRGETVLAYFGEKVALIPEHECWEWDAATDPQGYGRVRYQGKAWLAPRASYTMVYGPIPDGLIVRHTCDNPPCVNPDHLILGTHGDNTDDKITRGRHLNGNTLATHCKRGHALTPDNLWRPREGHRECRTCRIEIHNPRRQEARRKAKEN